MNTTLLQIRKAVLTALPNTVAIIHWGGAKMRGKIAKGGDVDILIVVDDKTEISSAGLSVLKKKFRKFDLDVYAIRKRDLRAHALVAIGAHGPYHMHELIHYQLKHESDVIYGDEKILKTISPMTLEQALAEIVPYVRDNMMSKLLPDLLFRDAKEFIDAHLNVILVIVRTLYSVAHKALATKEDALKDLGERHPAVSRLTAYLLKKYAGKPARAYPGLKTDMEKLAAVASVELRNF